MDQSLFLTPILSLLEAYPWIGNWYTFGVRWVLAFLAIFILFKSIRSLLQVENPSEIWAYLGFPNGSNEALTHWENVLGRAACSRCGNSISPVCREIMEPLCGMPREIGLITT